MVVALQVEYGNLVVVGNAQRLPRAACTRRRNARRAIRRPADDHCTWRLAVGPEDLVHVAGVEFLDSIAEVLPVGVVLSGDGRGDTTWTCQSGAQCCIESRPRDVQFCTFCEIGECGISAVRTAAA